MARRSREDPEVRNFILRNVTEHPRTVASLAAEAFGLSRSAINRYMKRLLEDGLLTATGKTRARQYQLKKFFDETIHFNVSRDQSEDAVWRGRILPHVQDVDQNIIDICQFGFTEMLNNVIDHSASPDCMVGYQQDYRGISISILDDGVGIFTKLQRDFRLPDVRSALLELAKGKLTSDADRHTGEGIFFTSRMFDAFSILSGDLFYRRTRTEGDEWLIETEDKDEYRPGTLVTMFISTDAKWTVQDIFERYQDDHFRFSKTHVPLVLARYPNEQLVSRSQAKRMLARFDRFSEVLLDFQDVPTIGQPFADEIFRVFQNAHPDITLIAINTSPDVDKTIRRIRNDN